MRFELVIFLIAGVIMANIYTDGKFIKRLYSYKKYYQMAGIAFGALMLYYLFRRNPAHAKQIIAGTNEYIKYLPVDRNTTSFLTPILDFTKNSSYVSAQDTYGGYNNPIIPMAPSGREDRILHSGKNSTKRSVSETKKKFVAARQDWKCENCQRKLPAWFEVDHKVRLEYGGSNHVDNLRALCRDCHGEKTAIENL
jgi:hypothetical protein